MDFLDKLVHSWGSSPEQKKREKEYNAKYYQAHKDKWTINVPQVSNYQEYDNYKYVPSKREDLPPGVYPRTDAEEKEWADKGIHYDPTTGRYYKVDSAMTTKLGWDRERGAARKNEDAKRANIARGPQDKARTEAEKLINARKAVESYHKKKPYLDSLEQAKKEANQSAAKKARKFIDGYVEYTLDSVKEKSKKASSFVKDFFGW